MNIKTVNHVQVSIPVGGEQAARDFYVGVLGLIEIPKPMVLRKNGGLWVDAGNIQIHFGSEDNSNRSTTKAHVAYEVPNLDAIRESLAKNRIEITDSIPIPGYQRFESRDPFGNRIEFMEKVLAGQSSSSAKIQIVPYTPRWKEEFEAIRAKLLEILDSGIQRIDHIGSTSLVNLAAKNVIDIQITVENLENKSIIKALESLGFIHLPEIKFDNLVGFSASSNELKKHFFKEPLGERRMHIHVRESGRVNQEYPILFRDFLRANSDVKGAYEQVKLELARRFSHDSNAYYAIKDPYMDTIYKAAKIWAREVGWVCRKAK
ncbi:GrpB family protein [Reinekea marina]|uniref:GrpB family protein n=1 Tax=Reinekea marina TaxID=1310421 RepID=A0ABV7WW06_9GAMM|nr:GrpB family protein [Reinekea marina]MDN3647999.1 GrpB family protein [Reinekea marina]